MALGTRDVQDLGSRHRLLLWCTLFPKRPHELLVHGVVGAVLVDVIVFVVLVLQAVSTSPAL